MTDYHDIFLEVSIISTTKCAHRCVVDYFLFKNCTHMDYFSDENVIFPYHQHPFNYNPLGRLATIDDWIERYCDEIIADKIEIIAVSILPCLFNYKRFQKDSKPLKNIYENRCRKHASRDLLNFILETNDLSLEDPNEDLMELK